MHDLVFGDWRLESTRVVEPLPEGTHLMRARAFGLKGYLGGYHSYVAHVINGRHFVFEVTDRETLLYQRIRGFTIHGNEQASLSERTLIEVERHGYQHWFGAKPQILLSLPATQIPYELLVRWTREYPLKQQPFHLIHCNCNTFVSWLAYRMNKHAHFVRIPWTVGTRDYKHWKTYGL